MKRLDQFTYSYHQKNGTTFRFLGKETNDEGEKNLLEGLLQNLTNEQRSALILELSKKHSDKVKEVLNKTKTPESNPLSEKKSALAPTTTPDETTKDVQQKIEAVLAEKESRNPAPADNNEKEVIPTQSIADDEKSLFDDIKNHAKKPAETNDTEHNQDRGHQDLDQKKYETPKKSLLQTKNEMVGEEIKDFRENVDIYVKQTLPERALDLKLGSEEISRRYGLQKHILNEIQVFAAPIWSDLQPRLQTYESKITNFGAEYKALQDEADPNIRFFKRKELVESFKKHINDWEQLSQKIEHAQSQLIEVCQKVMGVARGKMFARDYFQGFDQYADKLSHTLAEFDTLASEKNYNFSGDEIFWVTIPKRIQVIKKYLNFSDGGKLNQFSVDSTERFKKQANGIKFLHENKFFEEKSDQEFRKQFSESVHRVNTFKKKYHNQFSQVKNILEKDLNKYDEADFFDKYHQSKTEVYAYIDGQKSQIERFSGAIKEYGSRKFIGSWINNYDNESTRSEALNQMTVWSEFDTAVKHSHDPKKPEYKIVSELEIFVQNRNRPQKPTVIRFSLHDAGQMFKEYFEYRTRLWNRRSERAVAALGVAAFKTYDPKTESQIAKEFVKKDEETEDARVNEYKTQKGSYNVWELQEELYNTNDADEAKALIDMLIDKGSLEWFDPKLWDTLNRLEGFIRFKKSDVLLGRGEINRKLRESISNIWSEAYFNEWSTKIESSRVSAMDSYAGEYDSYETDFSNPNPRTKIMTDMVRKSYNGIIDGVEPARFEGFLRSAIPAGKQNGGPQNDQRVWFLIHGVASGVLGPEAFSRMNGKFLYDLPIVDFFTDSAAYKKDGKIVPEGTPGAEERSWNYSDYLAWGKLLGDNGGSYAPVNGFNSTLSKFIYGNIMNAESVRDRTQRGVRGGADKWDHDDGAMYTPILSANDVGMILTANSKGTEQMTSDFWRNFLAEYKFVFHSTLRQINEGDQEYGPENKGWQAQRKKLLAEIGDRMRAALTVTLVLSGNLGFTDGRPTTPFSREKWDKNTKFSPSAEKSKTMIDQMAKIFFKNSNIDEADRAKYESLIEYRAVKEGKSYKTGSFKANGQEYKTQIEASKLVAGDVGDHIFSSDLDVIERSLREFCQTNPILAGE